MHFQKLLPVCVAALVGASSLNLHAAPDTDIQQKAREALEKKMAEMDSQNSPTDKAPKKAKAAKVTPKPAPAPAPVVAAPAPAPAPKPAPVAPVVTAPAPSPKPATLNSEEVEKALAAERAEVARMEAREAAKSKAAAKAKAKADAKELAAQKKADAAAKKKADAEALAARKAQEKSTQIAKTTAAPEITKVSKPVAPTPEVTSLPPAELAKEQKLNQLLELYKNDKITPAEYHQERSKILGTP